MWLQSEIFHNSTRLERRSVEEAGIRDIRVAETSDNFLFFYIEGDDLPCLADNHCELPSWGNKGFGRPLRWAMGKEVLVLETLEDSLHAQVEQFQCPICRGGEDFVSIHSGEYYWGYGIVMKISKFFAVGKRGLQTLFRI